MAQRVIVGDQHYEFPDDMSDADIAAALKLDMPQATPYEPSVSMGEYTTGPQSPGATRSALEMGGQAAGGFAGSLIAPGPGTIAGETGGYALGSKGADLLLGENTGSFQKKLGEGLLYSVLPRGIAGAASSTGRGLIRSALKIPPTKVKGAVAKNAVETIIDEGISVSQRGLEKGSGIINAVESKLSGIINDSGSKIPVKKLTDAIDSIKPQFKTGSDPASQWAKLDDIKTLIENHPLVSNGELSLKDAQSLKKGLYQELKTFYQQKAALEGSPAILQNTEKIGKATWAESLRKEVLNDPTIPKEATDWLKRESNVIQAMNFIKRRANVAANMDPITFNDVIVGGLIREGVPAVIVTRLLRTPWVQSNIGIWLARGAKARSVMQPMAIPATNLLSNP